MKFSRMIAFVLVAAMLLSWGVVPEFHTHVHAHETEPTLTVGTVEGKPGDTLLIPVTISNNPGITGLDIRVLFDEQAVEVVNSQNNPDGPLAGCTFSRYKKDGHNPVVMIWDDGLMDVEGDGIIGYVEVKIKADAQPGEYAVVMPEDRVAAFNVSWEEIKFHLEPGAIKVLCPAHDYTEYVSDGNATCEADGTKTRECRVCGEKDTVTDEGSALGHSFTEYVPDGNATCETDGTETATCDRCETTDTRTDVGSHEAVEHSFPAEYTSDGNATCTADGTKSRVCTVCGEKETVTDVGSALGHSFTSYVSNGDATCETDGTETAKCDRCDVTDTRTAAGSALGHAYTAKTTEYQATAADCCHKATYYYTCANCGKQGTETFESGEFDKNNHVGSTEVRGAADPTEEEDGYTGDTYCLGCETVIAEGEVIPALGHTHDMKKTEAKDATCEADGNTTYWTCTKCGKIYADADGVKEIALADTVIAALGHSFTSYVSDGNATCEGNGTETAKCDRCDATDTRFEAGSALGHSFTNYVSDGNATCESDGTETAKCDRCDATDTRTAAGSMLDHSYTAKTTEYQATAADCCHKATYYYTCAGCGKQGTETFEAGEYDMTNHVGGTEIRGQKPATEEEEGYTGDTYCLGCETVIAEGEAIPVLDHTHVLVKTEAVEATCETAGSTAYWTCTKCGKIYADAEGVKEITLADTVIAALGHEYGEYVSDGNATCETDGTETAKCVRCDATDTRTAVGSALGHAWGEWTVTAPTCTEAGEQTRVCGTCGETETEVLEALGHEYGEYVSDGNATCETDGTETAKCDRCDATDTRTAVGSALGHAWGEWTVTDPTCTEAGEQTHVCGTCGETETEVLEALGHDYKSVVTEPTETEKGYTTHTCTRCGDSYVDSYVDPKPELDKQPETGDNAQVILWAGLLLASMLGTGAVLVSRKKWIA